jgi:GH24 family phage-related lysozyme (muramidase)
VEELWWIHAECTGKEEIEADFLKKDGKYFKIEKRKDIIFPLLVKPENDVQNKWGKIRNWTAEQGANMTTFNSNRDKGTRKHAARDLYTKPLETVVAIADGIVLNSTNNFYYETGQVTIRHTLKDGRDFIIRYGELDPNSIKVEKGEMVTQKQEIGKTGKLLETIKDKKTGISQKMPLMKIGNDIVFMIHFEQYSGSLGFDIMKNPLTNGNKPFLRRSDLIDSLPILQEGYRNTFEDEKTDDRVDPKTLNISQKGIDFIKSWEKFSSMPYNDNDDNDGKDEESDGYATIGYGYLIAYKSYKKLTKTEVEATDITWNEFNNGITKERATELFNKKLTTFENAVKRDITVPLYQYEYDALVSLLYNTVLNFLNVGGTGGKETKIKKNINNQMYEEGANEMADVTNNNTSGLVKRRKAEINIFKNNIYDSTH